MILDLVAKSAKPTFQGVTHNNAMPRHILHWVHQKAGLSRFGSAGCLTELPGTYFAVHLFRI